jgi:tRNA-modifying protein YgfZ
MNEDLGQTGTCRLTDWGVMRASGEEAAKFLHGQLTQDVEHLPAGSVRLAGYCSAKGRLLATLLVWRDADGSLLLACSADVLAATLKRLSMFVLRAKCKLVDASADLPIWGVVGSGPELPVWGCQTSPEGTWLRLPDAGVKRHLFVGAARPGGPELPADTWRWFEARSGVARVVAATTEQFVPQMVNLELVGGVNFQKGCYPGQEIVARSQYRGTLKRRSYVLQSPVPAAPGQEVFHSTDAEQPAGMVVLAGSLILSEHASAHTALVELKIAALDAGSLHLGAANGPLLQLGTLPYELPSAEAA